MALTGDTGNSATFALATTGAIGNIRNIGEVAAELGKIETSHLGTVGQKTYIPDDLEEPGEVEVEVEFATGINLPGRGVVETCTITYPLRTGESTAANHAGTGFISRVSTPTLQNGQLQVMKLRFSFNGDTGPTFTKSS